MLTRIWQQHGAVERRRVAQLGLHVIEAPEASIEAIRQSLVRTALFDYVEPDYYAEIAATSPNDPSYISQWHLPKIGSSDAWTRTTGSASVVVAVVDSGVYAAHPDLASKLIAGWNFVKSSADTSDVIGHGTEVAGTVAAATNNGIGVAGVSWGSLVMPLVVVDNTNFAAYSDIAAAIQYAVDRNIRVINVSIGGASASSVLQSAVDYAWSRNALVFAAAMNNGQATPVLSGGLFTCGGGQRDHRAGPAGELLELRLLDHAFGAGRGHPDDDEWRRLRIRERHVLRLADCGGCRGLGARGQSASQ